MRKLILLFSSLLILVSLAYTLIKKNRTKKQGSEIEETLVENPISLRSLTVTTGDFEVELKKEEDYWWVVSPHRYLANQKFIARTFQIMSETPPIQKFKLKKDLFGVEPGEAFFRFQYDDGQEKRLIVGDVDAPGGNIYVLNKDTQWVYVIHNIWSQFLFHPPEKFYTPFLPIPGTAVKSVKYLQNGKRLWEISSKSKKIMSLFYQGRNYDSPKEQWIWFFKKIREITLSDIQFNKELKLHKQGELHILTEKGNIIFEISQSEKNIYIPSINVFANIAKSSIQSLHQELKKVVNRAKK